MTPDLRAAAFGGRPDAAVFGVAADRHADPYDRWLAAVVLGGQGRYAAAAAALRDLRAHPRLASLAASTAASHARQLGAHAQGRRLDAVALQRAADAEARVDALLGLAADAIGLGRPGEAGRLHAAAVAGVTDIPWRVTVRIDWVATEVALATGRATDAVLPAERALRLSRSAGGLRHTVKSTMILGAALTAGGTPDGRTRARGLLTEAVTASLRWGMFSLTWPSALLLAEVAPDEADRSKKIAADAVTSVFWWSDAAVRRSILASPWMPLALIRSGDTTRTSGQLTT